MGPTVGRGSTEKFPQYAKKSRMRVHTSPSPAAMDAMILLEGPALRHVYTVFKTVFEAGGGGLSLQQFVGAFVTAVGLADSVVIMIAANVIALAVMLLAATPISEFVERHPTVKMLALAFLVLIGTNLVAEGMGQHISKGYTYVAMAFSVLVEMLNIRARSKNEAVRLRGVPHDEDSPA